MILFKVLQYPQTNGVIEVHEILQKVINKEFLIKKEKFDLEQCIIETLENYNCHKIHSSTGYTPVELKDTKDINIINNVIEKIKKTMKGFQNKIKEFIIVKINIY